VSGDLILHSGTVVTLDGRSSRHQAVAVRDGRVLAAGTNAEILDLAGPATRRVDLAGGTVLPGINDSHLHAMWWAESRARIDLSGMSTLRQVQDAVRERAARLPADAWVIGQGWHERRLEGVSAAGPTAADLAGLAGGRPVFLQHFSAHGGWLDGVGLRRAGIDRTTPDPEGGTFVRDPATGEPTGIVKESALVRVQQAIPAPSDAERLGLLEDALRELSRRGITSITDPLVSPALLRDYVALHNAGRLATRVSTLLNWGSYVTTSVPVLEEAMRYVGSITGLGDDMLRVGGCKLMADGVAALGTSWMSRPYPDGHCGGLVTEGEDDEEKVGNLRRLIEILHTHRFQVQVHATGDRACDAVVEAFADLLDADPWDARHVLIHANHPSDASIAALARHGLIANVNSLVKRQAAAGLVSLLDEEGWHRMMPTRSFLDAGVVVADASDAPVTDPHWPTALQMLVTRVPLGFDRPSGPDQRLTREEALRAWTVAPAYQDHAEGRKGTIEPGRLADLTVIAEDFAAVPDEELHALSTVMTVRGGEVVFEA
jgi:predicted amidohydrolase YtcJ